MEVEGTLEGFRSVLLSLLYRLLPLLYQAPKTDERLAQTVCRCRPNPPFVGTGHAVGTGRVPQDPPRRRCPDRITPPPTTGPTPPTRRRAAVPPPCGRRTAAANIFVAPTFSAPAAAAARRRPPRVGCGVGAGFSSTRPAATPYDQFILPPMTAQTPSSRRHATVPPPCRRSAAAPP